MLTSLAVTPDTVHPTRSNIVRLLELVPMTTVQARFQDATITGTATGSADVYHSIPFAHVDGPFANATLALPVGDIVATEPRPEVTLAVTISTPAGAKAGADHPVLAYIHGGSYIEGTHADPRISPEVWAQAGYVVVTLGYRLGMEGFVPFHDDEPDHYRGIDDCAVALEWIQKTIESFGGDPTNITLVGHSAGAAMTLWLARKDHYKGAFRRLVALSPAFPRENFSKRKALLRQLLDTPVTRRHLTALLAKNPKKARRGFQRFTKAYFTDIALGPAIFDPKELAKVPMLITATSHEFYTGVPAIDRVENSMLRGLIMRFLRKKVGLRVPVQSFVDALDPKDQDHRFARLMGDSLIRRWASMALEETHSPRWYAELAGTRKHPAVHSAELPHLFPSEGTPEKASALFQAVATFAAGEELPWPAYRKGTSRVGRIIPIAGPDAGHARSIFLDESLADDPLKTARVSFTTPQFLGAKLGPISPR
ncbi:carboxylesterase family protein [Corynebacterium renale]|uniref:carboxylesterase family protein n=1 Tax=Corynebacterium renale TaxID=1724 RepID=UPI000DFE6C3C|nr:carboxylesterase family protein [Corynebacterium renale]STC97974.1 carboxylesterase [Corynebacterium renale]